MLYFYRNALCVRGSMALGFGVAVFSRLTLAMLFTAVSVIAFSVSVTCGKVNNNKHLNLELIFTI